MTTKPAKDIQVGDRILIEDGRPVRVTDTGKGFWAGSVMIDFTQPEGERVDPTWVCVDRSSELTLA